MNRRDRTESGSFVATKCSCSSPGGHEDLMRAKLLDVGPQIIALDNERGGSGRANERKGRGRKLQLLDVVGKGSAATVYRALLSEPSGIDRTVAVKLYSAVASDETDLVLSRLVRTAQRIACVEHPNVAKVFECGLFGGRPFVVSELVAGVPLSALQNAYAARRRRLPLDLALFLAVEIAEALAGARIARDHQGVQLGMVHQAVSAREVLLGWLGEVKLTDFEANNLRAASSSVRSIRGVATRMTWMAPEVARGSEGDARSDVFSLGVLLRELLLGPRFPVSATDSEAIQLAREGFILPLTFQPHLPENLVLVMNRALEVDPELRYPNACPMVHDLRREAFAMGVGDGRWFLRRALEREWEKYAEEVTAERNFGSPAVDPPPVQDPADFVESIPISPRKKRRR
jgi:eukaryotic-like serine/threonine-protein kinase